MTERMATQQTELWNTVFVDSEFTFHLDLGANNRR